MKILEPMNYVGHVYPVVNLAARRMTTPLINMNPPLSFKKRMGDWARTCHFIFSAFPFYVILLHFIQSAHFLLTCSKPWWVFNWMTTTSCYELRLISTFSCYCKLVVFWIDEIMNQLNWTDGLSDLNAQALNNRTRNFDQCPSSMRHLQQMPRYRIDSEFKLIALTCTRWTQLFGTSSFRLRYPPVYVFHELQKTNLSWV